MASGYNRLVNENAEESKGYGSTNAPSVTSAPSVGYAQGNPAEFFKLCDRITTHLFTITNGTTNLEKSIKLISTPADSQMLRTRINQLNTDTGNVIQESTSLLGSLHALTHSDRQRMIRSRKIQEEFQSAATRFSEVQKRVLKMVRSARIPPDMVATELDAEASHDSTAQMVADGQEAHKQRRQLQSLEFEVAMQQEREQQVRALETNIVDMNYIMRQLSSMVGEQAALVDSIESNVESAHGHVEDGRGELAKAAAYQSKYRRRLCYLLLILVVVCIIIAIMLAIHFSEDK